MPLGLVNNQNVVFSNNTYNGPFVFDSMLQGDTVSWAQWTSGYTDPNTGDAIDAQDFGSTYDGSSSTTTTTSGSTTSTTGSTTSTTGSTTPGTRP